MQGIKEYNIKIASLQNTLKLTSSMKMISTVKMQKFMKYSANSDPWWSACNAISLLSNQILKRQLIPYCEKKEKSKKILIYVISSDRGLCGRFNAAVIETASKFSSELEKHGTEISFVFLGKKAVRYFSRRGSRIISSFEIGKINDFANFAKTLSENCVKHYKNGDFDEIFLIRTKKISPILNKPSIEKILPIEGKISEENGSNQANYTPIIEVDRETLAEQIIKYFIQSRFHMGLIESCLCEHSSRMTAMDSASANCKRLIDEYIQKRNRARQASITTEISEIVSGKEALAG